jgi:hypothetical protein
MKIKNRILTLSAFTVLGVASTTQAANLTSTQAGAWTDTATWGGTAPAFTTTSGNGDNLTFNHAVTVGATDIVSARAFTMNANGSVSVASGGNIYLNKETIWKSASTWDSSSGYTFNVGSGTKYAFQNYNGAATWLHNGNLNLNDGAGTNDALTFWARSNNNSSVTLAGAGLLTLQQLDIGLSTNAITAFIDRDLTTERIVNAGTNNITLNLMSGTTTTDELFALSGSNTIAFSGTLAELRVLNSVFSETDATTAIGSSFITSDVGALNVSTDGIYTVIAVPEPGSYALLAGMLGLVYTMVRRRN